ncbi:DUF5947 family protein [Planotetraspora phitsanulokensis]|uniref:Uncharacterized protein n=1 Tax=Planotetraspora phitsanulokensis TaxID=575192 RepID=A0A8J3XIC2_9ACTN|nr:DUF5947 family protein [Planotetraspora phitsanulokensis]GII41990.1 hypothetical protein Pph01_69930 [Planotetraspora phitsanulokensis]
MTGSGLRRFREPPPPAPTPQTGVAAGPGTAQHATESTRCELCSQPVGDDHGHVVDTDDRALRCVCPGCHLLFAPAAQSRYRAVPRLYLHAPAFRMTAADWDELQIPVRTAFFFHNSALGHAVAFYPSPAGATESLLPLQAWERILAANPELPEAEPDVEALLIDRGATGEFACHLVPISACYELVGLVRLHWKGFGGGEQAWAAIDGFFAGLLRRGQAVPYEPGGGDREGGRA